MSEPTTAPTVTIRGEVYTIPALTTGQVKRRWPIFVAALKDVGTLGLDGIAPLVTAQADLLLAALLNEYPTLVLEDIETLAAPDLGEAIEAIIEGVVRPKVKAPTMTSSEGTPSL